MPTSRGGGGVGTKCRWQLTATRRVGHPKPLVKSQPGHIKPEGTATSLQPKRVELLTDVNLCDQHSYRTPEPNDGEPGQRFFPHVRPWGQLTGDCGDSLRGKEPEAQN